MKIEVDISLSLSYRNFRLSSLTRHLRIPPLRMAAIKSFTLDKKVDKGPTTPQDRYVEN